MTQYSITEAKGRFSKILREAEAGDSIEITRQGKPVAYVVSVHRFSASEEAGGGFGDRLRGFRSRNDLESLQIDADSFLEGVRSSDPGREFSW